MPKAGIIPNCRYGHGDLRVAPEGTDPKISAVVLQALERPEGGKWKLSTGGLILDVFECPVCGYTELFERIDEVAP